jgi:hypothetical protein
VYQGIILEMLLSSLISITDATYKSDYPALFCGLFYYGVSTNGYIASNCGFGMKQSWSKILPTIYLQVLRKTTKNSQSG